MHRDPRNNIVSILVLSWFACSKPDEFKMISTNVFSQESVLSLNWWDHSFRSGGFGAKIMSKLAVHQTMVRRNRHFFPDALFIRTFVSLSSHAIDSTRHRLFSVLFHTNWDEDYSVGFRWLTLIHSSGSAIWICLINISKFLATSAIVSHVNAVNRLGESYLNSAIKEEGTFSNSSWGVFDKRKIIVQLGHWNVTVTTKALRVQSTEVFFFSFPSFCMPECFVGEQLFSIIVFFSRRGKKIRAVCFSVFIYSSEINTRGKNMSLPWTLSDAEVYSEKAFSKMTTNLMIVDPSWHVATHLK